MSFFFDRECEIVETMQKHKCRYSKNKKNKKIEDLVTEGKVENAVRIRIARSAEVFHFSGGINRRNELSNGGAHRGIRETARGAARDASQLSNSIDAIAVLAESLNHRGAIEDTREVRISHHDGSEQNNSERNCDTH